MSLSPAEKKHPQWEGLIAKNVGEKGSALPELSGTGCGIDNWARPVVLDAWAEEADFRREQEKCKRETKKRSHGFAEDKRVPYREAKWCLWAAFAVKHLQAIWGLHSGANWRIGHASPPHCFSSSEQETQAHYVFRWIL